MTEDRKKRTTLPTREIPGVTIEKTLFWHPGMKKTETRAPERTSARTPSRPPAPTRAPSRASPRARAASASPAPGPGSSQEPANPWADLDETGAGLSVDDFITTMVSRASTALRRALTGDYAGRSGLSISEWRMLSVLAHAKEMTFPDLVVASVADKAQVSRTLRLMQERGLVAVEKEGSNPRWQVMRCKMTPAGTALYRKVMPQARRTQAAMIRLLEPGDRAALYRALKLLRQVCEASGGAGRDGVDD